MRTVIFLLLLLAAALIQGRTVSKGLFQNTVASYNIGENK